MNISQIGEEYLIESWETVILYMHIYRDEYVDFKHSITKSLVIKVLQKY